MIQTNNYGKYPSKTNISTNLRMEITRAAAIGLNHEFKGFQDFTV